MRLKDIFSRGQGDQWIAISDMMSGLMVIFLLIALISIVGGSLDSENNKSEFLNAKIEISNLKDQIREKDLRLKTLQSDLDNVKKNNLEAVDEMRQNLLKDLLTVFSTNKLEEYDYGAEINKENGKITFLGKSIDVKDKTTGIFKEGSYALEPDFEDVLSNFFPDYLYALEKYTDYIEEIKIVGHASNDFSACGFHNYRNTDGRNYGNDIDRCIYIENMSLTHKRANSVLDYVLAMSPRGFSVEKMSYDDNKRKLEKFINAGGKSHSDNIKRKALDAIVEDKAQSRRVHFEVKLSVEKIIKRQSQQ